MAVMGGDGVVVSASLFGSLCCVSVVVEHWLPVVGVRSGAVKYEGVVLGEDVELAIGGGEVPVLVDVVMGGKVVTE